MSDLDSAEKNSALFEIHPAVSDDAPVPLTRGNAEEYSEFLRLKDHFEADPQVYKRMVRKR